MIGPHGLRALDVSTGTDMHARGNLHRAVQDGPRADSRVGIDRRSAAEPSGGTDDGTIADHAPSVETRTVGDQRVGADQAHLGDDGAGAYASARQQLRGGGNACRRIDSDSRLRRTQRRECRQRPEAAEIAPQ